MVANLDLIARGFLEEDFPRIRETYRSVEAWLFGSRVTGEALRDSDLDVILVSPSFTGIAWPLRWSDVLIRCRIDRPVQFFCYTPEEFQARRQEIGWVQEAVRSGVRVA